MSDNNSVKINNSNINEKSFPKENKNKEIDKTSEEEEEKIKNKYYFFLRLSNPFKEIEKDKNIKKNLIYFTKKQQKSIKEIKEKIKKYKKERKNIFLNTPKNSSTVYKNMKPIDIWNRCEQVYEKCKNNYNNLFKYRNDKIKERKKIKSQNNNINDLLINFEKKTTINFNRNISLVNKKLKKSLSYNYDIGKNLFRNSLISKTARNNNYQKCLYNINIRNKFINKGLNYFIEKSENNLSYYKSLSETNRKKNNINEKSLINEMNISNIKNLLKNKNKKDFPYIFKLRNNSCTNKKSKKNIDNFYEVKNFSNYKIKSVFYTSLMEEKYTENKIVQNNYNDIIDSENNNRNKNKNKDNIYLEDLSKLLYEIKNSAFNFFQKDEIFNLKSFSIIGITSGEGIQANLVCRILKKLLIDYFTNIKNYYSCSNLNYKSLINKQLIYEILSSNSHEFIKNGLNTVFGKIKNEGYEIGNTSGKIYLIFIIGLNLISIKIGDFFPYFIYEYIIDTKKNIKNIIIKEPFPNSENVKFEIINFKGDNNLYSSDKLEINTFQLNSIKNKNINYIQNFNANTISIYADPFLISKENKNNNMNNKINDIIAGEMKFIIIGNIALFESFRINYYVKYINESIIKSKKHYNNKSNEVYDLNLINIAKKIMKDSIKYNKQNSDYNNKEKFISIILIE